MKYMMFIIPPEYQPGAPADRMAAADFAPPAEMVAEMTRYNEDLAKAGILRDLNGLHPLANAARVTYHNGKTIVTDGPFIEAKEVVGGYWLIDVSTKEEAVEWAKRCPAVRNDSGAVIEVRQIFDTSEFPEEVRKAAESSIIHDELERHKTI